MIRQSFADWPCFPPVLPAPPQGACPTPDPEAFYRACRRIGYTGVEMVPPPRRAAARAAGLEILSLSGPGAEWGLNRLEHHATLLPQITAVLEEAAREQIPQVIVFSGLRDGQPDAEGIAHCARGIGELIPACQRLGVGLLFEMFNTGDHPDYQADSGAYGFELAQRVGSGCFKLLYDTYHMEVAGDDVMADLPAHIDQVGHLHLAAAPGRTCPADSTTLDLRRVVASVMDAGYDGWVGQEFLTPAPRDVLMELDRAYHAVADPVSAGSSA